MRPGGLALVLTLVLLLALLPALALLLLLGGQEEDCTAGAGARAVLIDERMRAPSRGPPCRGGMPPSSPMRPPS